MKLINIALLLIIITPLSTNTNAQTPAFIKDSLDAYIERSLQDWQIPGAAVCIVKDGKVVMMKGYGVKEEGKADAVNENTLFMIGSNTKAFTATALAILSREQKLSLDDKVQKWLPDFKLNNALASSEVTITDLLCHRIGMATFQGDFVYWQSDLTRKDVMKELGILKASYPFRTKWGYTNAAFLTAGEIIPRATGSTWEEYIEKRLLEPLQMKRTLTLASQLKGAVNTAHPHTLVNGKIVELEFPEIDNLAPAASISSSVSDMSHWLIAQLDSGRYLGNEVVPPVVIHDTRIPRSIIGLEAGNRFTEGHFSMYGLGWDLQEYDAKLVVSHTGGVNGFVSSVTLLPEENLGIVILTNTDQNALYDALKYEIMDAYLGLPYRNYSSLYAGYYKRYKQRSANAISALLDTIAMHLPATLPLKAFTGTYSNELYGTLKIELENDKLVIHFQHHKMTGTLQLIKDARFLCTYSEPIFGVKETPFTITNGKVEAVTIRIDDFVESTPYVFQKHP